MSNKTRTRTRNKLKYNLNNKTIKKNKKSIYSEDDYQSNDGMLTSVWGPAMWHYLHTMSFNYPVNPTKKDMKRYSEFILNLKYYQ